MNKVPEYRIVLDILHGHLEELPSNMTTQKFISWCAKNNIESKVLSDVIKIVSKERNVPQMSSICRELVLTFRSHLSFLKSPYVRRSQRKTPERKKRNKKEKNISILDDMW